MGTNGIAGPFKESLCFLSPFASPLFFPSEMKRTAVLTEYRADVLGCNHDNDDTLASSGSVLFFPT